MMYLLGSILLVLIGLLLLVIIGLSMILIINSTEKEVLTNYDDWN